MFALHESMPCQEQYSPERVRDAISILKKEAAHLSNIPLEMQRLPHELAQVLQARRHQAGLLVQQALPAQPSSSRVALPENAPLAAIFRRPRQDGHLGALGHSEPVPMPESAHMFARRQIGVGCFCATRSATFVKAPTDDRLDNSEVWIWKVLYVYEPGSLLPGNPAKLKYSETHVYEAQLWAPAGDGEPPHGRSLDVELEEVWHYPESRRIIFSSSETPDARRRVKKYGQHGQDRIRLPFTVLLRPCNIIGGGFSLSDEADRVPTRIRSYIESVMQG